ncbi:MAG: hypothetical protein EOO62_10695 [Hymenobacter sp.]|nr:MAG: hypothetical protein EOO62_10695 [Hymenobacter sp.]
MSLYKLLKSFFTPLDKGPASAPPTPVDTAALRANIAAIEAKYQAYLAEQRAEIEKEVPLFWQKHYPDFNAFLYRPAAADFIRREVLPIRNGDIPNNACLDNSHWLNKHYLNFPGPFYTGESDTCGTGDGEAPANVLYDSNNCEYVFRQPQNFTEFLGLLNAAGIEVLDSYSCDGNDHWTVALCREWWRGKSEIIGRLGSPAFHKTNGIRTQLYLDYLVGPAETDLRRYCYFLENGTYPATGDVILPSL